MSLRLTLDANLIGYWGFDEALPTDVGVDESSYADAHVTVTGSPSTQLARIGNGRTFTSSAYATPTIAISRLRRTGDLTLISWIKLTSLNNSGSFLRCIMSCSGPTTADPQLYGLYVDNVGRVVYKHTSGSGEVVIRTAAGVVHTNQLHNITVTRSSNTIAFYVDNFPIAVADVTVAGSGSAQPVPAPTASAIANFQFARSLKESDSAFFDGVIDESSVHDIPRTYQAYLREAYYRAVLRNPTFHLSSPNSVVSVSSYDMGLGVRWWCYERDKNIYVVRESPFGNFGPETQLTTSGNDAATMANTPELIYDPVTDVLLVLFIAGNRIFKLTANSNDDPATINMPFTADTGGIIKSIENVDLFRAGEGAGGNKELVMGDFVFGNRTPIKLSNVDAAFPAGEGAGSANLVPTYVSQIRVPLVAFTTTTTYGFGITIGAPDSTQFTFAAYRLIGGALVAMSAPVELTSGQYFASISPRILQSRYVIEALNERGGHTGIFSEVLEDRNLEAQQFPGGNIFIPVSSGAVEYFIAAEGAGGTREVLASDFSFGNRTPLKLNVQESTVTYFGEGLGGQLGSITQSSKTVMTQ